MSPVRLLAMTWARSLEFLRDRSAFGWNVAFPVLMVAGFAIVFSGPGQPLFNVAVLGDAPPAGSLHPFLATPHVHFHAVADLQQALDDVAHHQVDMVVDLAASPGRYWVNPESAKGETLDRLLRGAGGPPLERQVIGGAAIRYVDWVMPGLLGMNMMFSSLFGIGYVIVRYRKSGYLKRLNATPLTPLEFLLAQLLSRLALILLITVACFAGTDLILDFRMEGSYFDLFLVTLLGAVCMIAMALTVAARVTSEELAGGILNVLSWPMMVVSGVFFSLDAAPQLVQRAADLFPLTHLLAAARAIMLDGASLADLGYNLGVLGAMTAAFLAFGAGFFKWSQD